MNLECPDWLQARGGALKPNSRAEVWFVMFNGEPHYSVTAVPVQGKFGCVIRQTINGKRLGNGGVYPSQREALSGGLQELGRVLGWRPEPAGSAR